MGLLDVFQNPEAQLGLSLLSAAGPSATPMSFGQRLAVGMQSFREQQAAEEQRKLMQDYRQAQMRQLQEAELEKRRALEEKLTQRQLLASLFTPVSGGQANAMGGGPTQAAAQMQGQLPPIGPQAYQQLIAAGIPADTVKALAEAPTYGRPKVGPVDASKYTPRSIAEFERTGNWGALDPIERTDPNKPFMLVDGKIVANPQFQQYEISKSAAGATRVNVPVSVNTEKQFAGTLATDIAKQVSSSRDEAEAAQNALGAIGRINSALDSGKVATGPFATPEIALRQLGAAAGFGGRNNAETLANTRQAIQGLAQLSLNAAGQMRGQGAITEAERALLNRAASGDIAMTQPELKLLTNVLGRAAQTKIAAHQRNVELLQRVPGAEPIAPFFGLSGGQSNAPSQPVPTMRFNPQTMQLEEVR